MKANCSAIELMAQAEKGLRAQGAYAAAVVVAGGGTYAAAVAVRVGGGRSIKPCARTSGDSLHRRPPRATQLLNLSEPSTFRTLNRYESDFANSCDHSAHSSL